MKLRRNRIAAVLLGLALVGAGWFWWHGSATETAADTSPADPSGAFVHSMRGTVPDGDLRKAVAGGSQTGPSEKLPYAELKRMFEYYLSAVGEKNVDAIKVEIASELERRLPPSQVAPAKRLLNLYWQFKIGLAELEKKPNLAGPSVQAVRGRFLAMQDLRSQFFSAEESRGMFGFEDDYDMDAVARLEISEDPALNEAQKNERLAALDAGMSPQLREERDAPRVVLKTEELAQSMRAKGASDDDVYRMRAQALNPEAAARLADVDREEADWKNRIASYLSERSKLLQAQADAPPAEREAALAQLQQSRFNPDERPRLAAYEP